jgi:hypothetical protein
VSDGGKGGMSVRLEFIFMPLSDTLSGDYNRRTWKSTRQLPTVVGFFPLLPFSLPSDAFHFLSYSSVVAVNPKVFILVELLQLPVTGSHWTKPVLLLYLFSFPTRSVDTQTENGQVRSIVAIHT